MKRLWIAAVLLAASASTCAASFHPGVCKGSSRTGRGPVKVEVTFTDEAITGVRVVKHSETAGIAARAIKIIPQRILAAQSADVDVVSGASVSSRAIRRAAEKCISRHRTNKK